MPPKIKVPPSPSRMFPALHQRVANAVSKHIPSLHFHDTNTDFRVTQSYSTFVMGQFRCHGSTCPPHAWKSGKVTILIRQYANHRYNAEVFLQRCKPCQKLGTLKLDEESYVDRVSYRLLKWKGVDVERPSYESRDTPPHRKDLCEGCKRGICQGSNE